MEKEEIKYSCNNLDQLDKITIDQLEKNLREKRVDLIKKIQKTNVKIYAILIVLLSIGTNLFTTLLSVIFKHLDSLGFAVLHSLGLFAGFTTAEIITDNDKLLSVFSKKYSYLLKKLEITESEILKVCNAKERKKGMHSYYEDVNLQHTSKTEKNFTANVITLNEENLNSQEIDNGGHQYVKKIGGNNNGIN